MPQTRAPKAEADTPLPLAPPPRRSPVIDPATGLMQRQWLTWLELTWKRLGEAHAPSNAELDEGLSGTQGDLSSTQDDLTQVSDDLTETQTTVAGLEAELTTLQETVLQIQTDLTALAARVTALETASTAQEGRIAALEAWKTAMQAALPALVTVATVPALTNDPATAILLENDLTANWRPPVNANDVALQTAVNTVRNALAA